jgi:hypothetical protein
MAVVEELEDAWAEITGALSDAGFAVFPTLPDISARADWPDEDWRRFVALAAEVKTTIIYCQQLRIDAEEIAHFQEEMFEHRRLRPPLAALRAEPKPSPEEDAIVEELEGHRGEAFEISVGFMSGGVLHIWSAEASWWSALFERALATRDQQAADEADTVELEEQQAAELAARAREENWASKAAEDPRFLAAGSRHARIEALSQVVPEVNEFVDGAQGWIARRLVIDLTIEAEALAEHEVKPRLTRQALGDLETLAAEIAQDPEWAMASTKRARSALVSRFLKTKYGFVMATVAEHLASRKP